MMFAFPFWPFPWLPKTTAAPGPCTRQIMEKQKANLLPPGLVLLLLASSPGRLSLGKVVSRKVVSR
jgi:hypothetical protein